jgi:hypothetical protein
VRKTTTKPNNNTPPSTRVDQTCSASNCMRAGLSGGTESISPIDVRNVSIRGMIPNCETSVRASITTIKTFRAANACGVPRVRWLWSRELARNTNPEKMPIQWRIPRARPTRLPARCRVGSTENAAGATAKAKKRSPPIQMTKDNNIRNRRKDMRTLSRAR